MLLVDMRVTVRGSNLRVSPDSGPLILYSRLPAPGSLVRNTYLRRWVPSLALLWGLAVISCGPGRSCSGPSGASGSGGERAEAGLPPSHPEVVAGPSAAASTPAAESAAPRIYSKRRHTWIYPGRQAKGRWAGFLGLGGSVVLQGVQPLRGDGCAALYAVEPRGYVCLDSGTTLDPSDPEYAAIHEFVPRLDQAFAYQYGEARETPRYYTVPSAAEQRRREHRLGDHLAAIERLRSGGSSEKDIPPLLRGVELALAGTGQSEAFAKLPTVHEYREIAKAGSTVSWVASFDANGRTWLVTGDLALMPKDKVAPFPRSSFRGIALDQETTLPLAFVSEKPRPRYVRTDDGSVRPSGESWDRLSWLRLTGATVEWEGKKYLETIGSNRVIYQKDAAVVRGAPTTPWGEPTSLRAEQRSPTAFFPASRRPPPPVSSRQTWIEISIHGGWLLAYEGTRPVFATLIAGGKGQTTLVGGEPFVESATPDGVFSILGKYLTSTMAVTDIVHFDVTFAQPFHGTYALHASYSHDQWGQKVSMGCVNLSPMDAFWLFHWTEPTLPEGWHGMSVDDAAGYATIVVVHG